MTLSIQEFNMPLFGGSTDIQKLEETSNVKGLIKALKDNNKDIRQRAAAALGKIGDERAIGPLSAALNDPEKDIRQAAIKALGQFGDANAINGLMGLLNDADWAIRRDAVKTLGNMYDVKKGKWQYMESGPPPDIAPLIQSTADEQQSVCLAAIKALGQTGNQRVFVTLLALRQDETKSDKIRKAAEDAINKHSGHFSTFKEIQQLWSIHGWGSQKR